MEGLRWKNEVCVEKSSFPVSLLRGQVKAQRLIGITATQAVLAAQRPYKSNERLERLASVIMREDVGVSLGPVNFSYLRF